MTSDDRTEAKTRPSKADEALDVLGELRTRVEEATVEIERLAAELVDRNQALDELESITDALLGVIDTAVVVVGADRRVRALSRGAAQRLELVDPPTGKPLSAVLPEPASSVVVARLDEVAAGEAARAEARATGRRQRSRGRRPAPAAAAEVSEVELPDGGSVSIQRVTGGGAVLVLRGP